MRAPQRPHFQFTVRRTPSHQQLRGPGDIQVQAWFSAGTHYPDVGGREAIDCWSADSDSLPIKSTSGRSEAAYCILLSLGLTSSLACGKNRSSKGTDKKVAGALLGCRDAATYRPRSLPLYGGRCPFAALLGQASRGHRRQTGS